jgi:Flp pilus assembly protein TadG
MTSSMPFRRLLRDDRGATVVEFAFAFPALIVLIYAIAQLGMVYRAMSGIQHSLGEGARIATVWSDPAVTPTQIKTEMTNTVYGIGPGTFTIADPIAGTTSGGAPYLDLRVTYTQPTSLLLFPGPTISVSRSKRVYIAS